MPTPLVQGARPVDPEGADELDWNEAKVFASQGGSEGRENGVNFVGQGEAGYD